MQLDHRGKAHTQPRGIRFRKRAAKQLIKKKPGFEIRTGGRVLDEAYAIPEVQALGALFRRGKQPLQTTPEIRCFADIWFPRIVAAYKEDRRLRWHARKDLLVGALLGVKTVEEHRQILV